MLLANGRLENELIDDQDKQNTVRDGMAFAHSNLRNWIRELDVMGCAIVASCTRAHPDEKERALKRQGDEFVESVYPLVPIILNFAQACFGEYRHRQARFSVARSLPSYMSMRDYAKWSNDSKTLKVETTTLSAASSSSFISSGNLDPHAHLKPLAAFRYQRFDALPPRHCKRGRDQISLGNDLSATENASASSAAAPMHDL